MTRKRPRTKKKNRKNRNRSKVVKTYLDYYVETLGYLSVLQSTNDIEYPPFTHKFARFAYGKLKEISTTHIRSLLPFCRFTSEQYSPAAHLVIAECSLNDLYNQAVDHSNPSIPPPPLNEWTFAIYVFYDRVPDATRTRSFTMVYKGKLDWQFYCTEVEFQSRNPSVLGCYPCHETVECDILELWFPQVMESLSLIVPPLVDLQKTHVKFQQPLVCTIFSLVRWLEVRQGGYRQFTDDEYLKLAWIAAHQRLGRLEPWADVPFDKLFPLSRGLVK